MVDDVVCRGHMQRLWVVLRVGHPDKAFRYFCPVGRIDAHTDPDLDVLVHVLDGAGTLTTELGDFELIRAVRWCGCVGGSGLCSPPVRTGCGI